MPESVRKFDSIAGLLAGHEIAGDAPSPNHFTNHDPVMGCTCIGGRTHSKDARRCSWRNVIDVIWSSVSGTSTRGMGNDGASPGTEPAGDGCLDNQNSTPSPTRSKDTMKMTGIRGTQDCCSPNHLRNAIYQ